MEVAIEPILRRRFFGIKVIAAEVEGVTVSKGSPELEEFKEQITKAVRNEHDIENLKDLPLIKAYRDFFWEVGIDPTKIRPASEALIRRLLRGRTLPAINTVVDAYNLASIESHIAIGAFDRDNVAGEIVIRQAGEREKFLGIGMREPLILKGREVVVEDFEKLIAIYPYRDSDATKITLETTNVLLLMCGVPDVGRDVLEDALELTVEYVTRFCGGEKKVRNIGK